MITPNIENIIKSLVVKADVMEMGEKVAWGSDTALMRQAAAALQSQAERIKELEAEIITRTSYGDEQTDFAIKLAGERDTLRTQLMEIEKTEPTYYLGGGRLYGNKTSALFDNSKNAITELFTRPMPPIIGLQDVHDAVTADPTLADCSQEVNAELVEALEKLARLGNGDQYGNSDGNMIARDALRARLAAIDATEPVEVRSGASPKMPTADEVRELVNRLTAIAREFHGTQQLRERIANEVRPFTFVKPVLNEQQT